MPGYEFNDDMGSRANTTRSSLEDAYRPAGRQGRDQESDDLDRLGLAAEAMWSILKEKLGVTDDELHARMEQLDALDGSVDGRRMHVPRPCQSCGAKVPVDRDTCQYCGTEVPGRPLFP